MTGKKLSVCTTGVTVAAIADKIGAHTVTIYCELLNGCERDTDGEPVMDAYGRRVYRAEIAQRTFTTTFI